MTFDHPDRSRIEAVYRAVTALRDIDDPLLAAQVEGIVGRVTAMLAVIGAPVPNDALPGQERAP